MLGYFFAGLILTFDIFVDILIGLAFYKLSKRYFPTSQSFLELLEGDKQLSCFHIFLTDPNMIISGKSIKEL